MLAPTIVSPWQNPISKYLPNRLLLSLRVVLAFPMAWNGKHSSLRHCKGNMIATIFWTLHKMHLQAICFSFYFQSNIVPTCMVRRQFVIWGSLPYDLKPKISLDKSKLINILQGWMQEFSGGGAKKKKNWDKYRHPTSDIRAVGHLGTFTAKSAPPGAL